MKIGLDEGTASLIVYVGNDPELLGFLRDLEEILLFACVLIFLDKVLDGLLVDGFVLKIHGLGPFCFMFYVCLLFTCTF
jgi:hypothetical protein